MKTNFSLLFYLKKQKNYESGEVPVYLRITINLKRAEIATGRQCDPKRWNAKSGRMSGSKEDARSVNAYFANLQQKLFDAHSELVRISDTVTAESLKSKFLGRIEKPRMLLGIIRTIISVWRHLWVLSMQLVHSNGTKYWSVIQ
jgi:molybdopterin converting factor small subunit